MEIGAGPALTRWGRATRTGGWERFCGRACKLWDACVVVRLDKFAYGRQGSPRERTVSTNFGANGLGTTRAAFREIGNTNSPRSLQRFLTLPSLLVPPRSYQDFVKPGSANQDPIFTNNKLPDGNEPGYPGGVSPRAGPCWDRKWVLDVHDRELRDS
mgnify:CR=1 FL=1